MFTNPICHWSSGGPPPLLNFAPGQPVAAYGTPAQLPVDQPFHYSSAAMASAGIVGTPAHIYGFQEAQGNPVLDLVGSDNLTPAGNGTEVPLQAMPARGLYVDGTLDGSIKKAMDFEEYDVNQHRLNAAGSGVFDYGAATSFAKFTVFRRAFRSPALRNFYSKKNGTTTQGFSLIFNAANLTLLIEETGGANNSISVSEDWYGYHWHYALVYFNRNTNLMNLCTDLGDGVAASIAGWGTITSTQTFGFGYTNIYSYPGNMQIAYHAVWEGAQAEAFVAALAANRALLWTHGSSPAACPVDASPASGVDGEQLTTIIGEDATDGTMFAAWTGQNNVRGFPFEYNANFSSANKLGVATQDTDENTLRDSDDIRFGSLWNWTNVSVSNGYALAEATNPFGYRKADRVWSTAANARLESADMTCVAGETWSFGCAVIRNWRLEDVDVPSCRLIAWDDNANAEIAATTFDATDKWQWIRLDDFVIPVGCVDVQFWVEIPWGPVITHPVIGDSANRYINLCMCTAIRDAQQSHPIWNQGAAYGRTADNPILKYTGTAAGDFIKGAQGEIELTLAGYGDFLHATRILYDNYTGAAGSENRRIIRLNTSKQIEFLVYSSAGALVTTVTTAAIADLNTEHVIVCRWDSAGLPSGDKAEVSIDGGAYTGQNPAAWAASDTVTDHYYSDDSGLSSALNGSLASVRIWELPR